MLKILVNSVAVNVAEQTTESAAEPEPESESELLLPPNSISELPEKLLDSGVYLPGRYTPLRPRPESEPRPLPRLSILQRATATTHNSRLSLASLRGDYTEKSEDRNRNLLIN